MTLLNPILFYAGGGVSLGFDPRPFCLNKKAVLCTTFSFYAGGGVSLRFDPRSFV